MVLSAVGPYCDLGTPLIEAVLEASKNLKDRNLDPCDYLDLCGEPGWIEKNVLDVSRIEVFCFHPIEMQIVARTVLGRGIEEMRSSFQQGLIRHFISATPFFSLSFAFSVLLYFWNHL